MTTRFIGSQTAALFDRPGQLAIFSGLLIALSFPSSGFSFLAWIALIPLLIALENSSRRTAFRIGFTCGISAYVLILYWINVVITRYGHLPWAVSIPLYLLLAAWLALFFGLAALIARAGEQVGIKTAFSLPVAWVACDLIRSFLFSGFPWAMLGHSQYRILPLIQIADISGVFGITLLIVLANVVLYRVLRALCGGGIQYPVKSVLVLLLLLVATLVYGFNRLNQPEATDAKPVKVALIQGNIAQDVKWSPGFQEKTIDIYEQLTRTACKEGVDLVIWPESALPFFFQDELHQAERIKRLARELSVTLLVGSPAHELRNGRRTFLNSAFVISPTGETIGRSDKIHLVPFGEFVPLGRLFPFISKMVVGIGDFSPGERAIPLQAGQTQLGTLICFEGIFPDLAREYVNAGARILVNITNDAWFGKTSAPYQHLSIGVFRAVETRTPLLRAANTGVTAIIDHNGHIRTMTPLFEEAFRTGEIRPGTGDSLYLKIGDTMAWLCVLLSAGIAGLTWLKRKKITP
ncbi:apolipoprotein N-acyltransferase [Pelotalea chapellei]|uniref:Apolipoprotein N-acyltransferase n=1 Tax=Pelotalea chapellei TaxID=44671 RepID=A0ABS5UBH2_9BACT|nr:apolipoprotein N-acyltransferase [Pelotalea chapellei]